MAPLHTVDYLTKLVQSMTSSELQHVTCTIHSDQPDQPSACNLQVMAAHGWASAMNGLRLLSFLEIVEYASSVARYLPQRWLPRPASTAPCPQCCAAWWPLSGWPPTCSCMPLEICCRTELQLRSRAFKRWSCKVHSGSPQGGPAGSA